MENNKDLKERDEKVMRGLFAALAMSGYNANGRYIGAGGNWRELKVKRSIEDADELMKQLNNTPIQKTDETPN